jgi:lipoprotein-anchoring transpeptidase ErfK/SrfK
MRQFIRYLGWMGISIVGAIGWSVLAQRPSVSDRAIANNPLAKFHSMSALSALVAAQRAIVPQPSPSSGRHRWVGTVTRRSTTRAVTRRKGNPQPTAARSVATQAVASAATIIANPSTQPRLGPYLVIDLSHRQVSLYQNGSQRKKYPIAIGRPGWETPTGNFRVMDMRQNPTWINPFTGQAIPPHDPQNPLGGYWIGFWTDGRNWIGFHGTPQVDSVGTATSHGCIRMYRQDIAELFAHVTPGMSVIVQP